MSLAIDPSRVAEVLLHDGWHKVAGTSFDLDSYEFVAPEGLVLHGGGKSNISATGFLFTEQGVTTELAGPLSSILAVRLREEEA